MVGRDPEVAAAITGDRRNPRYLREVELPASVTATTELETALEHPLLLFCVPTSATRELAGRLAALEDERRPALLSTAKGIERGSGIRMSEILAEALPEHPLAVLSGPNHAEEIGLGQPTCAVIGCRDESLAVRLQETFSGPRFRCYTNDDLAGIELGGAIKNVYAIAAGIAAGLGLGDNASAALVTRALAEMTRLGVRLGGRIETFAGLSGVGDLIATCFSAHSRNHRVGVALGQGQSLDQAVAELGMVAEGVPNTLSIYETAHAAGARTPIIDAVHGILYQDLPAARALDELLSRDPRPETD